MKVVLDTNVLISGLLSSGGAPDDRGGGGMSVDPRGMVLETMSAMPTDARNKRQLTLELTGKQP